MAVNLDNLGPRKGRRGFFKLSIEEKTAAELTKINSQLKIKDRKLNRCGKLQKQSLVEKKQLELRREHFPKKIKLDTKTTNLIDVDSNNQMIV